MQHILLEQEILTHIINLSITFFRYEKKVPLKTGTDPEITDSIMDFLQLVLLQHL